MKRLISNTLIYVIASSIVIMSCETTSETFDEFTKKGETVYVGVADSVLVAPGFEKLRFWVAINADPKISKGKLESNDGSVSHEFEVVRTKNGRDTVQFDLELAEGEYTFGLFLLDDKGNRSIRREVQATVLGQKYQSSLINRSILNLEAFAKGATFHWSEAYSGMVSTTLTYEDADGVMQTIDVPNGATETMVDSYKVKGQIKVTSTYKPSNAIDLFSAVPFETKFPGQFLLDKSIIVPLKLAGDASDGCYGSNYTRLTDGKTGEFWHSCEGSGDGVDQYPFVMSFDMGVKSSLSSFRIDERSGCCGDRSPATLQIWGTNDVSGTATQDIDAGTIADWEADATAKGWTKLLDVTGNNQATFEVNIPETVTKFRYIRIVGISAINGGKTANFDEFTFWATGI